MEEALNLGDDATPAESDTVKVETAPIVQAKLDDRDLLVSNAASGVYRFLEREAAARSKSEIVDATSLLDPLVAVALNNLMVSGYVKRVGIGRGTKYAV